jgi:hypothetical protein
VARPEHTPVVRRGRVAETDLPRAFVPQRATTSAPCFLL